MSEQKPSPRDALVQRVRELPVDPSSPLSATVQRALGLARALQRRALELQTGPERRQQRELERMLSMPADRVTLTQLTDQAFRAKSARRSADQLVHILDVQGVPRFFSAKDRALLRGFQSFGGFLPGVSMPLVREKIREETANVVLPAEPEYLAEHLAERRAAGLRMNVNYLGEALLGEQEARHRLQGYVAALQQPYIEVVSVKISTIYSQISSLARRESVAELSDRLELLFRTAMHHRFRRADGVESPKLVYLDMEEFRDLELTLQAFMGTLDRPGLDQAQGGIALQAYLPDSDEAQRRLLTWAARRVADGKAPPTLRIVKGANMEAERVEAAARGWPQAPFTTKVDTDANYRRMVERALQPENAAVMRVGVASHNVFEVAFALVLGVEKDTLDCLQIEMLEGMANHQRRALEEVAPSMLLYAPATTQAKFLSAIGYLIRRLDENTGPENFLRHSFHLEVGSETWNQLEQRFLDSMERRNSLPCESRRNQNRLEPHRTPAPRIGRVEDFGNEPDTDFALTANIEWARGILDTWRDRCGDCAPEVPVVVAGKERRGERALGERRDPSRPGVVASRHRLATLDDLAEALDCATADPTGWRKLPADERTDILSRAAEELCQARGTLMGAALAEGGKHLTESDPEVSEAIDFVRYYAATANALRELATVTAQPLGVVAVVTPWNFPIAIPSGGVAAALAAGNTVILKPSPETVLVAFELCQCFWRAGVPREALQLLPCAEREVAERLVVDARVDAVVFTGSTATALHLLAAKPAMKLLAETGGKNATIVTALSDRELAIKQVLHSAFSHSGQKCSATSLLVLEAEVYDDPAFRETLVDAVESLKVGSAWDLDAKVTPLIGPAGGPLNRALHELDPGESWAVYPQRRGSNPQLWSPAVKWGVHPGSFTHMTELFGPVLGVMRAENLDEAIALVNATGYGLTSGLSTLDEREIERWVARIRAGNLYVNRGTTGAIVQRQPFGGIGKSAIGPGIKAGGPNYVATLMRFTDRSVATGGTSRPLADAALELLRQRLASGEGQQLFGAARDRMLAAAASYDRAFAEEFGRDHDDVRLLGQDNLRRYLPIPALRVRVHPEDTPFEIVARVIAAKTVGAHITVSSPPGGHPAVKTLDALTEAWGAQIEFVEETDEGLAAAMHGGQTDRIRFARPERVPELLRRAAAQLGAYLADVPVLAEGRIELLSYVREQSISCDYHRYGNLGARAEEARHAVR